jgi:hypothetical protein
MISFSNCSSVLPFVSGANFSRMRKYTKHIPENRKNVCGASSNSINTGKPYANAKHATHRLHVATDTAIPLIRVGNISEMSTHVTGASVAAYVAMNASTKKVSIYPSKTLK